MTSAEVFVGTIICSPLKFVWKLKVEKGDLIAHEDYDSYSNINDIGLIRLASEIPQHSSVNYISLPIRDEAKNYLIGKTATTIGFGKYSDSE